ncbi:MAG: type II toxin-antitoxin system RelB/DinJ family antitoxin [Candidatus Paceibacteria bacterium]
MSTNQSKTKLVKSRVSPELKEKTEEILEDLGLNTSQAIRLFLKQVELNKGLPFKIKVPNEKTKEAIKQAKEEGNTEQFETSEELFEDLDI